MPLGISVVICTHNGAARLAQTVRHLAAQRVKPERPWEFLLIDNASADNTPAVARQLWLSPRAGGGRASPDRVRG
jgi:glycosyltransferase involved in cell wall biosynthesis